MKLKEELVLIELESASRGEVLTTLGDLLFKYGYVTDDFVQSVLEREKIFPTGLSTSPYGVAIPHTDGNKVLKSQIAFASLKNPVQFYEMGNSIAMIDVKLIFMLAFKEPDEQLKMLQRLTMILQDEEMILKLSKVKNVAEVNAIIQSVAIE